MRAWQSRILDQYAERGYTELVSGFRRYGPIDPLKVINTPIQGTAFHVLLDKLVQISTEMRRRKMRSHLVIQIHDSILFDVVQEEAEEVVDLASAILTSSSPYLIPSVPLEVEWKVGDHWGAMEEF